MKNAILYAVIATALAVAGVIGTEIIVALQKEGHDAAITEMEKANEQNQRNADAAEDAVMACTRAGGEWLRAKGYCSRH